MMRLRWTRVSNEDRERKAERDIVMASIKRCSISTMCASVTDFIIAALVEIQFSPQLIIYYATIRNVDLLINQICILGTFDNFIGILIAFCHRKYRVSPNGPSNTDLNTPTQSTSAPCHLQHQI